MSILTVDLVKKALLDAGFEVFRQKGEMIELAERVRSHLMDARVCVRAGDQATLSFIVRGQRSDFPSDDDTAAFDRIRRAVVDDARAHGFTESAACSRTIHDPMDASVALDVWHELTFSKAASNLTELATDVEYALSLRKCVTP